MLHTSDRWTAQMVRALPDDGNRYELVSGQLVVTPAPRRLHQLAIRALVRALDPWVARTGRLELLWSPADLSLGEDEVLQPDLFVYPAVSGPATGEWDEIRSLQLVIEVLSPSTARYDRTLKRRRYQRAGVPEYWIVDLDARVVERWRPQDARPETLADRLTWAPDPDGPALDLDLVALFAEIHGDP